MEYVLRISEFTAPGSIMIMGEHAVLHGYKSIVTEVPDSYIKATVSANLDDKINIHSNVSDNLSFSIDKIDLIPKDNFYKFVIECVRFINEHLKIEFESGINIVLDSNIDTQMGYGSSAAATVATLGSIYNFLGLNVPKQTLMENAITVVRAVQDGRGSGSDVALSVFGGTIAFDSDAEEVTIISDKLTPLEVEYVGYKTPTVDVIKRVEELQKNYSSVVANAIDGIGACVDLAISKLQAKELQEFGFIMNAHQGFMQALGVSDLEIEKRLNKMRENPEILGAKISGSGLGDCIIGLKSF